MEAVIVWEDNLPVYALFEKLGSQWRVGPNGATGLDHNVMFHRLDRLSLDPDAYQAMEDDLLIMEHAALKAMREQ